MVASGYGNDTVEVSVKIQYSSTNLWWPVATETPLWKHQSKYSTVQLIYGGQWPEREQREEKSSG